MNWLRCKTKAKPGDCFDKIQAVITWALAPVLMQPGDVVGRIDDARDQFGVPNAIVAREMPHGRIIALN